MKKLLFYNYQKIRGKNLIRLQHITCLFVLITLSFNSLCIANSDSDATEPLIYMPLLSEPGAADQMVSLDFDKANIRVFIKTIGHLTGVNFLIDDKVSGTVTLISPTQVRLAEVYKIFESMLQVKGYAAVPSGKIVKIIPRADAAKSNLLIRVGNDPEQIPVDDSFVTQIIPIDYADVSEISELLTPLISPEGSIATYPNTKTIIVTDTSSNIHRVVKLIQKLDVEGSKDNIVVIPLKYSSAQTISEQITEIMQRNAAAANARNVRAASTTTNENMKVLPDDRTNSIVVISNQEDIIMIRDLVLKLDIERPIEASNVHVMFLKHAEAAEVEKSLSTVLLKLSSNANDESANQLQVTSDTSTNSLIVVASPQDFETIEDMIKKLDIVREQVLVEFQIMEATDDVLKEIGVDWATLDEAVADSVRGFGYTNLGPRLEAVSGDLEGMGVGVYQKVGESTEIGAILKAMENHSGVNVLSTPHIMASNHTAASIIIADNVPYVSQSRVTEYDPATPTAIRTYDFKDVGIELKVVPHVSQNNFVRLEIDTSYTKLVESATGLGNETPTTAQRKVNTVVSVNSGTTVVIGGLMRDDKEKIVKKVPLLGDIPIFGELFKFTRERNLKTNLILFITPHVLSSQQELDEITRIKQEETESAKENKTL
ncbi:MAG: type II secretion system secretin GspD [Sedimentisphaerales bacterium]|nr:type II secretion system secretin GspD [Sedimentisphaerales bacterium]